MPGGKMKKLQIISGMVIMAFAAVICFDLRNLPFGTPGAPGPAFFPLLLGIILFFLALLFIVKTALGEGTLTDSARSLWTGLQWKQVPYTLAALLGYALFLDRLGYLICTWLLMVYLFWGKGAKGKGIAIIGALLVSVISYLIFRSMLKVRLPLGLLSL